MYENACGNHVFYVHKQCVCAVIWTWEKTEAVSGKLHAILGKKDRIKCRTIDDSSDGLL